MTCKYFWAIFFKMRDGQIKRELGIHFEIESKARLFDTITFYVTVADCR